MRAGIKDRCGMGWQVVEQSGKCKVTFRPSGQSSRQSTVLPVEWDKGNAREIEDRIVAIKEALDSDPTLTLKSAATAGAALGGGEIGTSAITVEWQPLFDAFETYKVSTTEQVKARTFEREYKPVLEILETCALAKPHPRNARQLLEAMVAACPTRRAGMASRKSLIGVACQLLKFSIDKKGLGLNRCHPWRMTELGKFLLSVVVTAFFAVSLVPYGFLGLFGARLVGQMLDGLFSQFGTTTPLWLGMVVLVPLAIGWVAAPIALLVLAFRGIWEKPKSSRLP